MDIELHPAVSLQENTLNFLVAPPELLVDAINSNLNLQRYKILFISGNYSRILSRLSRNITELDVRRAFTSFQLMTIIHRTALAADIQGGHRLGLHSCIRSTFREDFTTCRPCILLLRDAESSSKEPGKT